MVSRLVFIADYDELCRNLTKFSITLNLEPTQNQLSIEKDSVIIPQLLFGAWNDGPFT